MFSDRLWVSSFADAAFKARTPTNRQDKSPANQTQGAPGAIHTSSASMQIPTNTDEVKLSLPPRTISKVDAGGGFRSAPAIRPEEKGSEIGCDAKSPVYYHYVESPPLNETLTTTTATTPPNAPLDEKNDVEIKTPSSPLLLPPSSSVTTEENAATAAPLSKAERRNEVISEIVKTESSYVESLYAIIEMFSKPLARMAEDSDTMILTHGEVQKIFNNIEVLSTFNVYFLNNLKTRTKEWDAASTKIGDLFLQFVPFFRMYSQYTANYEGVPQFIQELLNKNVKFARFCDEACTKPNCSVGLISLLVMPVQRVPRYQLLLQELLRTTAKTHPDYEDLDKALSLVTSVATQIDQDLAAQANRLSIHRFQDCFIESLTFVSPSRRLIRHGRLTKISSKGDRDYEFFLFNDLLGYANYLKKKQKKYSLARTMDLADFLAVELTCVSLDNVTVSPDEQMPVASPGPCPSPSGPLYTFVLTGKTESLALGSHDQATVQAWVKDLAKCIEEAQKQISLHAKRVHRSERCSQKVEWKPDGSVTHCPQCGAAFTMFVRKHHCRQCGNVVCAQCSTTKKMVLGRTERVCDSCSDNGVPSHGTGTVPEINLELWHQQVRDFIVRPDWGRAIVENAQASKWWRIDDDIDRYKPTHNIFKSHSSISNSQAVKAEARINAPPRSVCAFLNGDALDGLYENVELIRASGETHLIHHTIKTIGNFWNATQRDFVFLRDCKKLEEGAFSIVSKSVQSPLVPPQRSITRGITLLSGYLIQPHSEDPNQTHLTYVAHYDPRGSVPAWMKDRIYYDQRRLIRHLQTCGPEMARFEKARVIPSNKQVSWTDLLQACGLNPPTSVTPASLRALDREDELYPSKLFSPAIIRNHTPKRSAAQQKRAHSPHASTPTAQRHRGPPLTQTEEERLRKANSASKTSSRSSPSIASSDRIDHTGTSPQKLKIESLGIHDEQVKESRAVTPSASVKRSADRSGLRSCSSVNLGDFNLRNSPAMKRSQSYFLRSSSEDHTVTDPMLNRLTPNKKPSPARTNITPPLTAESPITRSLRPRSSISKTFDQKSPEISHHFSRLLLDETNKRTPSKHHLSQNQPSTPNKRSLSPTTPSPVTKTKRTPQKLTPSQQSETSPAQTPPKPLLSPSKRQQPENITPPSQKTSKHQAHLLSKQSLLKTPQKSASSCKLPIYRSQSNYELRSSRGMEDQENQPSAEELVMVADGCGRGGLREALQELSASATNVMTAPSLPTGSNKRERRKSKLMSPEKSAESSSSDTISASGDQWDALRLAIQRGDSDMVDAYLAQIQHQQKMLEEQVLQVQNYLAVDNTGTVVLRMEKELSEANLKLCEARSENDRMVFKLEQLQDKFVKLKKSKICSKCASQPVAKHDSSKPAPVVVKRRTKAHS